MPAEGRDLIPPPLSHPPEYNLADSVSRSPPGRMPNLGGRLPVVEDMLKGKGCVGEAP